MRRMALLAALAVTLGCAASRPAPTQVPALCVQDRTAGADTDDFRRWTTLVLRGVDPTTQRATSPALDCTGTQVRWEGPALACEDGLLARTAIPERAIAASDVIVAPISSDRTLVWIVTSRFASGEALGPVALVETTSRQLRVVALGPLRAYPLRARLHLETLGDREVLVAEGDSCVSAGAETCSRAVRLVPIRAGRFVSQPLVGEDRRCVSPAWFDVLRRDVRPAGTGWERVDLAATLTFEGEVLLLDEQVVVNETDGPAGATLRVLRRAQAQRVVRWTGDILTVSAPPLLGQMIHQERAATR
jgi:hypothetical protein